MELSPMITKILQELQESNDEQQTAIQIAKMLKEPKLYVIRAVIKHIPRPLVISCLHQTIET